MIAFTKEQEDELREHFNNPKNFGKMLEYDAKGVCVNPEKKAKTTIFLKVNSDEKIEDIKFLIKGCKSTLLTGSLFTETIKGHSIYDGVELSKDLLKELEADLTPDKEKPRLVMNAYLAAVQNYEDRKNGSSEDEKEITIHSSSYY
jgi:nitrogen fixation NifU-like protein